MEIKIYLNYISKLRERLLYEAPLVQIVLGPRQVGKTTTTLKFLDDEFRDRYQYSSADDVFNADAGWLRQKWLEAVQENKILVIDEIQKCFNWAETVKALFDESKRNDKAVSCILLGSSSLEIQKGLSESLTGRFQLNPVHHWNFEESRRAYGITFDQYLHYGGYPGSYDFIGSSEWYPYVKHSIVGTVVEKDILQFNKVNNPSLFKQAFELLISYPAQEISFTKLLGQLQDKGNVELIKYYISLYEGAYLVRILEKFSTKPLSRKSSSPKIIPLAPCFYNLQIRSEYSAEERGRVFESLVGAQLLRTGEDIFYWREGQKEIDYVMKIGRAIYGIEVKSGRNRSASGLNAFKEKFSTAKLLIISTDNYQQFEKNPVKYVEEHAW
jgi:predicted AAA+ superfamily ATPase